MTPLQLLFLLTAFIILASAVMVVASRRMMISALWLVLSLFGVAVIFVLLDNSFFAIVQVIIYIGAIAILIVFAIMLTKEILNNQHQVLNKYWWLAAITTIGFLVVFLVIMAGWNQFGTTQITSLTDNSDITQVLGKALVDPEGFVIPFEIASVLLLASLVGAVYIAAEKKEVKNDTVIVVSHSFRSALQHWIIWHINQA